MFFCVSPLHMAKNEARANYETLYAFLVQIFRWSVIQCMEMWKKEFCTIHDVINPLKWKHFLNKNLIMLSHLLLKYWVLKVRLLEENWQFRLFSDLSMKNYSSRLLFSFFMISHGLSISGLSVVFFFFFTFLRSKCSELIFHSIPARS